MFSLDLNDLTVTSFAPESEPVADPGDDEARSRPYRTCHLTCSCGQLCAIPYTDPYYGCVVTD